MKKRTEIEIFAVALFVFAMSFYFVYVDIHGRRTHRAIFFDVGQGDSQLLQAAEIRILEDAGPDSRASVALDKILIGPDRRISVVLVTHPEADHIGGLPEILRKFEVGVVVYPAEFSISTSSIWQEVKNLAATRGVPLVGVLRGGEVRVPGLQMQALWPVRGCIAELPTNECALVMRARLINADFLFTGDIGLRGERALLAVGGNGELRADVLKIPHHGSKNSILPQFFSAVSSSFAVVQAGANNTYGHASPELLRRLSAFVGHLWSTAQEGGVEVIPSNDPQGIRISSWE